MVHSDKSVKNFQCDQCSYRTHCKTYLQIHKRKIHSEKPVEKQNVCTECQKDFTWKGLLLHHVCFKSESDLIKEEVKFKCPACDLVQSQRFFMIHYKKHHGG